MKTIEEIQAEIANECSEERFGVLLEAEISVGDYESARQLLMMVANRYINQFIKYECNELADLKQMTSCNIFVSKNDDTSATICKFCGREKWLHSNTNK